MTTTLIELEDGMLLEVDVPGEHVEQISGGVAKKVNSSLDRIKPILINTCKPITEAWRELNQDMHIQEAEVELGLSFEGEGNVFVTKARAGANLTVRLVLKPRE